MEVKRKLLALGLDSDPTEAMKKVVKYQKDKADMLRAKEQTEGNEQTEK